MRAVAIFVMTRRPKLLLSLACDVGAEGYPEKASACKNSPWRCQLGASWCWEGNSRCNGAQYFGLRWLLIEKGFACRRLWRYLSKYCTCNCPRFGRSHDGVVQGSTKVAAWSRGGSSHHFNLTLILASNYHLSLPQ